MCQWRPLGLFFTTTMQFRQPCQKNIPQSPLRYFVDSFFAEETRKPSITAARVVHTDSSFTSALVGIAADQLQLIF